MEAIARMGERSARGIPKARRRGGARDCDSASGRLLGKGVQTESLA
jgi:hypothetical protein